MSLLVCMKAAQTIIMAADSRGTVGDPRGLTAINDTYIKIFPLGQHLGIGLVGVSEFGNTLLDELKKKNIASHRDIGKAIPLITKESAKCFNIWFGSIAHVKRPAVLVTVVGHRIDAGKKEPIIYMLLSQTNFAPQLFGHMPCMSGVPQYAVYLAHRYYDPSISVEQAKALAEYLIAETASQDPKVGGPIRIAEINPESGYRELTKEEVEEIHASNKELNEKLRQFFLTRG